MWRKYTAIRARHGQREHPQHRDPLAAHFVVAAVARAVANPEAFVEKAGLVLAHQPQHPVRADLQPKPVAQPRPDLAVALAAERRVREISLDRGQQAGSPTGGAHGCSTLDIDELR